MAASLGTHAVAVPNGAGKDSLELGSVMGCVQRGDWGAPTWAQCSLTPRAGQKPAPLT